MEVTVVILPIKWDWLILLNLCDFYRGNFVTKVGIAYLYFSILVMSITIPCTPASYSSTRPHDQSSVITVALVRRALARPPCRRWSVVKKTKPQHRSFSSLSIIAEWFDSTFSTKHKYWMPLVKSFSFIIVIFVAAAGGGFHGWRWWCWNHQHHPWQHACFYFCNLKLGMLPL